jgi:DNA-binding transcriptional LysR family regulator
VLDEFRRLYPMIKVAVQRSLASHISDELINHSTELGVLTFRPEDPLLRSIVVYRDELTFVVPPQHPLASSKEVTIRQLGTEWFVAHNVPSPYREKVLEAFSRHHVRDLHFERKLRIIYRKNSSLSHAAQAFLKVAEMFAAKKGEPYMFQPEK